MRHGSFSCGLLSQRPLATVRTAQELTEKRKLKKNENLLQRDGFTDLLVRISI